MKRGLMTVLILLSSLSSCFSASLISDNFDYILSGLLFIISFTICYSSIKKWSGNNNLNLIVSLVLSSIICLAPFSNPIIYNVMRVVVMVSPVFVILCLFLLKNKWVSIISISVLVLLALTNFSLPILSGLNFFLLLDVGLIFGVFMLPFLLR